MRTLGVNGSGDTLYLAVAQDGEIIDVEPYTFGMPAGLPVAKRLPAARSEAEKLVKSFEVDRVRILDPETSWQAAAVSVQPRFALETLLALGAADAGVDCDRLARATSRTLVGLTRDGSLHLRVKEVTGKVGKLWAPRMRDLAALAAIAAERQG